MAQDIESLLVDADQASAGGNVGGKKDDEEEAKRRDHAATTPAEDGANIMRQIPLQMFDDEEYERFIQVLGRAPLTRARLAPDGR